MGFIAAAVAAISAIVCVTSWASGLAWPSISRHRIFVKHVAADCRAARCPVRSLGAVISIVWHLSGSASRSPRPGEAAGLQDEVRRLALDGRVAKDSNVLCVAHTDG